MTEINLLDWIKNKSGSHRKVLKDIALAHSDERDFKEDVKIGDLVEIISNYDSDGHRRYTGFILGFNERRNYDSVLLTSEYLTPIDEWEPEDGKNHNKEIEMTDLVYYRVLERDSINKLDK